MCHRYFLSSAQNQRLHNIIRVQPLHHLRPVKKNLRLAPEAGKQCFSAAHCEAYLCKQCSTAVHCETCLNKQCFCAVHCETGLNKRCFSAAHRKASCKYIICKNFIYCNMHSIVYINFILMYCIRRELSAKNQVSTGAEDRKYRKTISTYSPFSHAIPDRVTAGRWV